MGIGMGSIDLLKSFKFGASVGLFFAFWGGLEIALGLLFDKGRMANRLWRSAGFLAIWGACLYWLINYKFQ